MVQSRVTYSARIRESGGPDRFNARSAFVGFALLFEDDILGFWDGKKVNPAFGINAQNSVVTDRIHYILVIGFSFDDAFGFYHIHIRSLEVRGNAIVEDQS